MSFSRSKYLKYYLIMPSLIILLTMVVFPLLFMCALTFYDYNLTKPEQGMVFVGLDNYIKLFSNKRFLHTLFRSIYYAGASVTGSFVIGFGVALLLNRTSRFVSFYATCLLIPMMMTPVIVGLGLRFMYDPMFGIIPYFLSLVGVKEIELLGNAKWVLHVIILSDIWQWTPFIIAVLYAGLKYVPQEPLEAARVDGASSFQTLRHITIPLMRGPIVVALVIRFMDTIRGFDKIFMMTKGGPGTSTEILSIYTWRVGFNWFKMGEASTIGVLMLLIIVGVSTILASVIKRG